MIFAYINFVELSVISGTLLLNMEKYQDNSDLRLVINALQKLVAHDSLDILFPFSPQIFQVMLKQTCYFDKQKYFGFSI